MGRAAAVGAGFGINVAGGFVGMAVATMAGRAVKVAVPPSPRVTSRWEGLGVGKTSFFSAVGNGVTVNRIAAVGQGVSVALGGPATRATSAGSRFRLVAVTGITVTLGDGLITAPIAPSPQHAVISPANTSPIVLSKLPFPRLPITPPPTLHFFFFFFPPSVLLQLKMPFRALTRTFRFGVVPILTPAILELTPTPLLLTEIFVLPIRNNLRKLNPIAHPSQRKTKKPAAHATGQLTTPYSALLHQHPHPRQYLRHHLARRVPQLAPQPRQRHPRAHTHQPPP